MAALVVQVSNKSQKNYIHEGVAAMHCVICAKILASSPGLPLWGEMSRKCLVSRRPGKTCHMTLQLLYLAAIH